MFGSVLSPFLKTGATLARFQAAGTLPRVKLMVVKGATIPGAASFKHRVLISPGPDDLPGSSDRISSSTVSCVTVFNRNVVLIVGDAGSSISVSVLGRTPAAEMK